MGPPCDGRNVAIKTRPAHAVTPSLAPQCRARLEPWSDRALHLAQGADRAFRAARPDQPRKAACECGLRRAEARVVGEDMVEEGIALAAVGAVHQPDLRGDLHLNLARQVGGQDRREVRWSSWICCDRAPPGGRAHLRLDDPLAPPGVRLREAARRLRGYDPSGQRRPLAPPKE